jgi:hypothetical protein
MSNFFAVFVLLVLLTGAPDRVIASTNPVLTQVVSTGTMSMDMVDALYQSVASPVVAMGTKTASSGCQTVSGTLGTSTQQIYGINSESGISWNINLVASTVTDLWTSSAGTIDYNDPAGDGCTNGQMTVNPGVATLTKGQCTSCDTGGLMLGTSASFSQGVTDSITILSGEIDPDDIGDYLLTGVAISQKIPANKPAGNYVIKMVLTITAK